MTELEKIAYAKAYVSQSGECSVLFNEKDAADSFAHFRSQEG